ncbi:hypothetical protein FA95DRAFT_1544389 [Auriscalpium vulgare]|uniref:Uncharacterized protein n=1 Tax=Auriscalpium vulgare TaxID=40419 RepID=A0ACB8RL90_9AGAM|nr:hypothetical protein FA95DRAFT_1544389 [Auriscalpium vulgare]
MFTPPASPKPHLTEASSSSDTPLTPSPTPSPSSSPHSTSPLSITGPHVQLSSPPSTKRRARADTAKTEAESSGNRKRRIARHTRLTVLLVPLVLILITLSTRWVSHPAVLDLLSPSTADSQSDWSNIVAEHQPHQLQRRQSSAGAGSGISFPSGSLSTSATPTTTQSATPSIPTIPTQPPVLPTPFPQAFDTTLSQNYTTGSCQAFMTNMTSTEPFRQCRPFSLLWQTSNAFLLAQNNVTALNIDVWGTCNTPLTEDQCLSNIGWFASELPKQCATEIADDNATVQQALQGLQAFGLMRQVACLADQSTSAYCYVEAAVDKNPSDLYFYSLPFGLALPNKTVPTCSGCTKSVLALYGQQATQLDGLKQTYNSAAKIAESTCGQGYVANVSTTNGAVGVAWGANQIWWNAGLALVAILLVLS